MENDEIQVFWVSYMFGEPSIMSGTAGKEGNKWMCTPAGGGTPRLVYNVHLTQQEAKAEAYEYCKKEAASWNEMARAFK